MIFLIKFETCYSNNYFRKVIRFLVILTIFFSSPVLLRAQATFSITGTVKDVKGLPLPGAGIYLSGYKMAAVSNDEGKFSLSGVSPGNYDVLFQMMGFKPISKNVLVSDKSVQINIVLDENIVQLNEVLIKPDPDRSYYMMLFKENFIGRSPNAAECKILNPDVIITDYDKKNRHLSVTATDFIIIENKSLGYRIKYLLNQFSWDQKDNMVYYAGHPTFEELPGSSKKKREWIKKREIAYYGSTQHFISSLYQGKTKDEGYIIYKLVQQANPNRLPDTLIEKNIERLRKSHIDRAVPGAVIKFSDSLSYWAQQRKQPKTIAILNKAEVLTDTLVKQMYSDVKTMNYVDDLYVIYTKERETKEYTVSSGYWVNRGLDMPDYQISTLKIIHGPIHFYPSGAIYNPKSLLTTGFWAYEKVADMVPMDYIPLIKR